MCGQGSLQEVMRLEKIIIPSFFFLLLIIGGMIYRDYGISCDELFCTKLGQLNFEYITQQNSSLLSFRDKDYPPAFETAIIAFEEALGIINQGLDAMFYFRHFFIFLSFYLGVLFLYLLIKRYFQNWFLGLLACLMLVLCPRIFAHSFFNSKDIPFMAFMIMGAFTSLRFLDKPNFRNACAHAFCCALAIDTRIVGVLMPAMTLILYALRFFKSTQFKIKEAFYGLLFFLFGLFFFVILMWPMLWFDTAGNFNNALKSVLHIRYPFDIFYMGHWLKPSNHELPWHYLPLWIISTVPIMVLVLFSVGVFYWLSFYRGILKRMADEPLGVLALIWFFVPVLLGIIIKPTMYDGWRHFYFIYPPMIIIAMSGYRWVASNKKIQIIILSLLMLDMSATIWKIQKLHPYEHLYFNALGGVNLKDSLERFQLDSWGVEFRRPLERILKNDNRSRITIYAPNVFTPLNLLLMSENQRARLKFVKDYNQAEYCIFDYYFMKTYKDMSFCGGELERLNIQGVNIVSVYRKNDVRLQPKE